MTLRKDCTITVPDCEECQKQDSTSIAEDPDASATGTEDATVKASLSEQENSVASTPEDMQSNSDAGDEHPDVMQSSVKAPGFELILAIMGVFGALYLRR